MIKKIFIGLGIIIIVMVAGLIILIKIADKQPAVNENYYQNVFSEQNLEKKYTSLGSHKVSSKEFDVLEERVLKYKIWYPSELENNDNQYPLVIMANGTGVPYTKYEAVFNHLASWGFIVIGNDDPSSALGDSTSKTLDYILTLNNDNNSFLYNKIDINNIGVAGHSQGGCGVINAITKYDNSNIYKVAYVASATTETMITNWKLDPFKYDIEKVNIPIFMVAGTGKIDAETISPLEDMKNNFDNLNDSIIAVMARRKNTDHGKMLSNADGYMTAWFMWHLQDDEEASQVFIGDNAEILINENWQDIERQNTEKVKRLVK